MLSIKKLAIVIPLILSLSYCVSCTPSSQRIDGEIDVGYGRSPVLPIIEPIQDQFVTDGILDVLPVVKNKSSLTDGLHWTKAYGPDEVSINPQDGRIFWRIDEDLPGESFHIGIKVSALNESKILTFVVHHKVDQVITVGENSEYKTISKGLAALKSGGTLIVEDGVYEGSENYIGFTLGGAVQHPPSGSANQYTTIMARNPGETTLQNGAYIRLQALDISEPVSYVAFKGFFVKGGQIAAFGEGKNRAESSNRHHHLKFINNGVEGGEAHSPFNAFRCDDILFENNYAFGGGRYKFASYQASNIVMRRNVARYDRGTVSGEPKGTYSIYTTLDAEVDNNLAIDGDHHEFVNTGELAGEFTTPTTSGDTRARFHRNLQLNSAFLFGNMDEQISGGGGDSDVEHHDVVSWDVRPYNRYVMTWGSAWFDHMTMGNVVPRNPADQFFNGYHNNTRGITNSILHNFQNGNMFYSLQAQSNHETVGRTVERFGVDSVNISRFPGQLIVTNTTLNDITDFDPLYSPINGGLRYLPRLEPGSQIANLSNDDAPLGATLLTFKGKSGTLYGEDGFDEETSIPMWPFPLEDLIKRKFSEYQYSGDTYNGPYHARVRKGSGTLTGNRGFAVNGQTLTNYVWEYLGDVAPPLNVTATSTVDSITIQWSASADISQQNVKSYRIYDVNTDNGELYLLTEVDREHFVVNINELDSNTEYAVGITAVTYDGRESAVGYPAIIQTL